MGSLLKFHQPSLIVVSQTLFGLPGIMATSLTSHKTSMGIVILKLAGGSDVACRAAQYQFTIAEKAPGCINIPCLILKTGRRIVYRLVGYNEYLKEFFKTCKRIKVLRFTG